MTLALILMTANAIPSCPHANYPHKCHSWLKLFSLNHCTVFSHDNFDSDPSGTIWNFFHATYLYMARYHFWLIIEQKSFSMFCNSDDPKPYWSHVQSQSLSPCKLPTYQFHCHMSFLSQVIQWNIFYLFLITVTSIFGPSDLICKSNLYLCASYLHTTVHYHTSFLTQVNQPNPLVYFDLYDLDLDPSETICSINFCLNTNYTDTKFCPHKLLSGNFFFI